MALSPSDLIQLLQSLRAVDGVETIRMQELIEAEATDTIGAARASTPISAPRGATDTTTGC